jgi:hypothetical protein
MLKDVQKLRSPDPYFSGEAGSVGSTLEQLHEDMRKLELPGYVPESVRWCHDAVRNAYIPTSRMTCWRSLQARPFPAWNLH